ncbi:MAG: hypothetical protein ABS911_01970 [Carnobacterium sp.]|uniref:hypothetical protein n=1 Tax=Carnobacterium sp. TaxID=48221 RepID=UPI0033150829
MKKLGFLLIFVVVLAGCDVGKLADKLTEEIMSSSVSSGSTHSAASSGEDSVEIESAVEDSEEFLSEQISSDLTDKDNSNELTLVPQDDEIDKGLTVETDDTLAMLEDYVKENPNMGYENDVTIIYTGETYGESPNLAGIFFIINRTDSAMKDIRFTYTFGKSDSELVFDKQSFTLTGDSFGTLEPNTVMPMYLVVDPSKETLLKGMNTSQLVEEIHVFDYTDAGKSDQPTQSEESAVETSEDELSLVIPKQNADNGQTFDNNPLMAEFQQLVAEHPDMGFNNDVTVMYSGLYDKADGDTLAYFFVINKTGIEMKNIRYQLSYGNKDGEMVWDKEAVILREDIFGPFKPNTVLPLTMAVPKEKVDLFFSITNENLSIKLDEFTFEE